MFKNKLKDFQMVRNDMILFWLFKSNFTIKVFKITSNTMLHIDGVQNLSGRCYIC